MALSTTNSGANSGMNSAEPLSSRNCSDAAIDVDENANEAANDDDDEENRGVRRKTPRRGGAAAAVESPGGAMPTTPTTPRGMMTGGADTSMNTSALTSPDEHRSPEPVLDADIERLRQSVPSLLSAFKGWRVSVCACAWARITIFRCD